MAITNNKEFNSKVQYHILESLADVEEFGVERCLMQVVICFRNWYSRYEQKMQPNKSLAFRSFLEGLPSVVNFEYTHFGIENELKHWFGNDYKEYTGDEQSNLYYHLLYREFNKLCKRHKINF